jgi:hypothetical protein
MCKTRRYDLAGGRPELAGEVTEIPGVRGWLKAPNTPETRRSRAFASINMREGSNCPRKRPVIREILKWR